MKYFLDTEFLEGPQKEKFPISLFRKQTPNTIDLISIGIVAEDGREYYAISKDFNLKEAWNRWQYNENFISAKNQQGKEYWIRENVLKPIFFQLAANCKKDFSYKNMKNFISRYRKTNKQIAEGIKGFCRKVKVENDNLIQDTPEFYAYYADYDWVVFCWLFGKMIDLPDGFPKYCRDLKQIFDQKAENINSLATGKFHSKPVDVRGFEFPFLLPDNLENIVSSIKNHPDYPKQENEHSAIDDARWNKKLYEFLNTI
jgi:hypothetical protein